MGMEILIATITSDSLCDAWEIQSQWERNWHISIRVLLLFHNN